MNDTEELTRKLDAELRFQRNSELFWQFVKTGELTMPIYAQMSYTETEKWEKERHKNG